VFIGEISTGAANDLERTTDILKAMVQMYGMSDVAGLMVLEKQRNSFLGGGMSQAKEYSEKMSEAMDNFIKTTLDERYAVVKERLEEYRDAIEKMVELLYAKENITGEQVRAIIEVFEGENNIPTKLSPKKEITRES
jgi:cell division protease FtsH